MKKAVFTLLILLTSFQFIFAQEKPKAKLVDEFGKTNCCNFLGKLMYFVEELKNSPDSKGLFVIHTNLDISRNKDFLLYYRRLLFGQLDFLSFDENRILIKNVKTSNSFNAQFWIVPKDAEIPKQFEDYSFEIYSIIKKPTMFYSSNSEDGVCSTNGVKDFAETLNSNSDLNGHIVIFDSNNKAFINQKTEIIKTFEEKYKTSQNYLKFFYKKSDYSNIEYWLVPKK
ncbi:MAG: hypothetical protein MUC29_03180 [Pyrinomonadaceae bacterium]|jgi:hypothetical protein|nr:hypothetical protein [Pyrinomonadaceae bacterium]